MLTFFFSEAGQTFIQNAIAFTALVLASLGVRNWKRERRDIRRAEVAERSLELAYQARDAFSAVRSPFSYGSEGSSRQPEHGESVELKKARDSAFVAIERINHEDDLFKALQSQKYAVSAAFGQGFAEPLGVFLKIRNEIVIASQFRYRAAEHETYEAGKIEGSEKFEALVWENWAQPDPVLPRLDDAVAMLERNFRPYVAARFRAGW